MPIHPMPKLHLTDKVELDLIRKIVDRAWATNQKQHRSLGQDRQDIEMDLIATHLNGCPLDFAKLLAFDDFNFAHDLFGIAGHLDRTTGKLTRLFSPRCSK